MSVRIVLFLFSGILILSCSNKKKPLVIEEVSLVGSAELDVPKSLSEWGLFEQPLNELNPTEGVIPYDLNSPLFSDYSQKARFVKLPEGATAKYNQTEVLGFPEGTLLIKNFYYELNQTVSNGERKLMETRLLIHEANGWNALTYVWNEEQTEANLEIAGRTIPVSWTNKEGVLKNVNYSVPNLVQCKGCHERSAKMSPIGPSARQLNKHFDYGGASTNQLTKWHELNLLDSLPDQDEIPKLAQWDDEQTETLDARARAWLEINCAHCHRADGPAKNTGLHLLASEQDLYRVGVGKPPVAAGRGSGGLKFGIVPGNPESSILLHRIASDDPGVMMPELGRKLEHEEGVALIRDWIAEMKPL